MKKIIQVGVVFLFCLSISACHHNASPAAEAKDSIIDSLVPEASHSFRVDYYKDYKVITVFAAGKSESTQYVLCGKDQKLPASLHDAVRIESPVSRIACLSTTHVGALKLLDARQLIAVVANAELICDSAVNSMVRNGQIKNAGHDYQPDYEMIAQAHPDLLFTDGENGNSPQIRAKLKALHIAVVSSRDYFEQDPLARAEWIRFFAAFVNKEKEADSIFEKVKTGYELTRNSLAEGGQRPTVFCNLPYNGIWYMPCGKNYVAMLIAHAGGDFLWEKDDPINGLNLTLNFEQVYQRAANADIWINPGVMYSLKQIGDQDAKFKLFKAYKSGQVYNCTNRLSASGGMDMWETGTFRPDIVLGDLAAIFHSPVSPQGLYYYKQLK